MSIYYCYMCHDTKSSETDGKHKDPFVEGELICTVCHNHHILLRNEERDDWAYYDNKVLSTGE